MTFGGFFVFNTGCSRKEITEHWEWLEQNLLQTLSIFENENDINTFVRGKIQVVKYIIIKVGNDKCDSERKIDMNSKQICAGSPCSTLMKENQILSSNMWCFLVIFFCFVFFKKKIMETIISTCNYSTVIKNRQGFKHYMFCN